MENPQLLNILRDTIKTWPTATVQHALQTALYEQPCGAIGDFGHVSNLQRFVCKSSYHTAIRHIFVEPHEYEGRCQRWIPNPDHREGGKYVWCGIQLDDGTCTTHGKVV